ncbi:MAG: transglutaminase domain-containing protein, partial [Pseudomonadota bacterium]
AAGGVVDTTALWSVNRDANAAASAPGLDNRHHFVNAYLEGFAPFATDNLWVPLYTLSRVKRYAYDHASVTGYRERWQTSREAFYYTRGDCEDHALALADWLIEMGEDARVVLGEYKDEGHAWVALFRDGQVYLMEATEKYRRRGPQQLTLAAMRPSYRPEMMFNRDFFWFNTGPALTVKYDGERWVRKSRYLPPG